MSESSRTNATRLRAQRNALVPGNINLDKRPRIRTPQGTATVRSIGVDTDRGELLLPTATRRGIVSPRQAVRNYQRTGKHLGLFKNRRAADRYANALHVAQSERYRKG